MTEPGAHVETKHSLYIDTGQAAGGWGAQCSAAVSLQGRCHTEGLLKQWRSAP